MKTIPFWLMPGSWGLKGRTRQIAEAEYNLTGYALDAELARINAGEDQGAYQLAMIDVDFKHGKIDAHEAERRKAELSHAEGGEDLKLALLTIDLKHRKIDQYTYDTEISIAGKEGPDLEIAKLDVDLKHNKISAMEYDRKRADVLNEPYMAMPKISWDPKDASKTYFELDYNEPFVHWLELNGYTGTEEQVINRWLNDVCNSVLDEMVSQEPDFVRTVRTVRRDDGKTEHS